MKKKMLFISLLFIFLITTVNADSYYIGDNGEYWLCGTSGPCFPIQAGTAGANFDLRNEHINYEGLDYYYDESLQEKYYEGQKGLTRMYYYMDGEKYVLCSTKSACRSYTFDNLVKMGASINYQDSIRFNNGSGPGVEGDIYYYNASASTNTSTNNNNTGTNTGSGDQTVYTPKTDYCTRLKEPLQFVGRIVLIVKILIPIVIIIFGTVDFFRAIIASKDDEIKKSSKSLLMRALSGIVIFFIPTIISLVFSLVSSFADIKGDFDACQKCIFRVSECK